MNSNRILATHELQKLLISLLSPHYPFKNSTISLSEFYDNFLSNKKSIENVLMLQYLVTVSEEVATRLYQDRYLLDVIEKSITVSSEFPLLRYVLILWQRIFSYESI